MTVKATFLFEQTSGKGKTGGWSETWYKAGTLGANTVVTSSWAKRRAGLLSNKCRIIGVRVTEIGGMSQVYPNEEIGILGNVNDIPQMAISCSIRALGLPNMKYFQLRGVPDTSVTDGDFVPTAAMQAGIDNFAIILGNEQWQFRAKGAAQPPVQVVSVLADGTFSLAPGVVFNVNDVLVFSRMKTTAGTNVSGSYMVLQKVDNQNGKIANWPGGIVSVSGKAAKLAYSYLSVDKLTLQARNVTTRKVGRPFAQYVGRRRKR